MPTGKPSVLFIGNFPDFRNGSRAASEDLSLQLRNQGWQTMVTSRTKSKALRLVDMLRTAWASRHRYDTAVVDVYSGPAFFYAEAVCNLLRLLGKRYTLILHGGMLPSFAAGNETRFRSLLKSAALVTTPSHYLLEAIRPYRADLMMIPNPLEVARYRFTARRSVRPKLVWLRSFHETYNPSMAVEVLALLKPEFPGIHLSMIGPDKGDGALNRVNETAARLGVTANLEIVGGVGKADVPSWLADSDIFLNTTNADNTPISVLEAMACGLCIVSTNAGGLPYLLTHDSDSLLVPTGDAAAMAAAVRRYLTDPGLAQELSTNARRKAETFDWSRVLPLWLKALTGVSCVSQS